VTFPVAAPLDRNWTALRADLQQCWARSTSLANWAIRELAKHDVVRQPGQEKIPPMPPCYLYGLAAQSYPAWSEWAGSYAAAQSLLRAVEQKYRKERLATVWRSERSLSSYRYPVPYPIHNAVWKARYEEIEGDDGQVMRVPVVDVKLASHDWTLRLRSGRERWRQLAAFAQLVSGEAVQGELALYRVRASQGAHRSAGHERAPGGGADFRTRLIVKLVAWLPREQRNGAKPKHGTLEVRTGTHALLVAVHAKREQPWVLKQHQVRRWVRQHQRRLLELNEDAKSQRRRLKDRWQQTQDYLDKITHRHRCRLKTFCDTASAWLVNFAERLGVAELRYDDSERGYCDLPWSELRQLIARKCDDKRIGFVAANAEAVESAGADDNGTSV
jgi:hypothetical protein